MPGSMNQNTGASSLLGGASFADQAGGAGGETEEERRKRLLQAQAARLLPSTGASSLMQGYGGVLGG